MGSPAQKLRTQTRTANFFLCGLSRRGQLSTSPVTRASTLQNSLSTPNICQIISLVILRKAEEKGQFTRSITKNIAAQKNEAGSERTSSG